jgi:methionyl-tRNA formyltransferase
LKDEENEWNIKIYEATFLEEKHNFKIGTVITTKKELNIAVKSGMLIVKVLQFPGKKKMKTHELLNGVQLSQNAIVI